MNHILKYGYHITDVNLLQSIRKKGIKPSTYGIQIILTDTVLRENAKILKKGFILKINISEYDIYPDILELIERGGFLENNYLKWAIPSKNLIIIRIMEKTKFKGVNILNISENSIINKDLILLTKTAVIKSAIKPQDIEIFGYIYEKGLIKHK